MRTSVTEIARKSEELCSLRNTKFPTRRFLQFCKENAERFSLEAVGEELYVTTWHYDRLMQTFMKEPLQARRWVFESATDPTNISEVNFRDEFLQDDGEPDPKLVEFYEGRLRPFNPETDPEFFRPSNITW